MVTGIGELLWDNLPGGRRAGGAPANFAYHAGALGARASLVSAVGADADGAALRETIRRMGLDDTWVAVDAAHATGAVEVTLDAAGKPSYVIATDRAWDYLALTPALSGLARGQRAVCFGTLAQRAPDTRAAIHGFLRQTAPDCLRVLDVNLRGDFFSRDILATSLRLANVLKISDEELPVVARLLGLPADQDAGLAALRARFDLRLIVLTRGAHGSIMFGDQGRDEHPGAPADAVDTVGAGDSFTAAVVVGLLRGWPLPEINRAANRLAAYVCTQRGATPALSPELVALFR